MNQVKTKSLLNLDETIAKDFMTEEDPWKIISKIKELIMSLGKKIDLGKFEKIGEDIWIAKSAKVANSACIVGPAIIDENVEIRHCAYIRGNVIVGKNSVVGNSTELKNCILFNNTQVPHFNYVGDSILGYKVHMGAGSITSNVKSDKTKIAIKINNEKINTDLFKLGAIIGDYSEIGCNSVLNPGTMLGKNVTIYPLSNVRGYINDNSIYKDKNNIICKK